MDTSWGDTGLVEVSDCEVTADFAEGPFYQSGAPSRVDLRTAGELGTDLRMTLIVRSERDCRLIGDAQVDLWHVMQTGLYDLEGTDMHYRCNVQTGFDGRVEITTLKPISYYTETGKLMPSHFHIKVSAEGHDTVTTQLRFANDPDDDFQVPPELMLETTTASDGVLETTFVITLATSCPAANERHLRRWGGSPGGRPSA
jgi:catechol 1,2-dioxygenase